MYEVNKTPERCQGLRFDVFIVDFEHISHFFQCFCCSFEQKNASWVGIGKKTHDI